MGIISSQICALTIACWALGAAGAEPAGTAFVYQGQLKSGDVPLHEPVDFAFSLWDALEGGNQIGGTLVHNGVDVANGLFTQELDFGLIPYGHGSRWLEVAIRVPATSGPITVLAPRQELTGSPFSIQTRGLFVDDDGHLGVGTQQPESQWHVKCQSPVPGTGTLSSSGATVQGNGSEFASQLNVGDKLIVGPQTRLVVDIASDTQLTTDSPFIPPLTNSVFDYQPIIARIAGSANQPALIVNADGDVGIRTQVPSAPLTVNGRIESSAGGYRFPDGSTQTTAASGDAHSLDAEDGNPENALFVNEDGEVGIGTLTPTAQLEIRKSGASPSDTLRLDSEPDENPRISFTVDGQVGARIRFNDTAGDQLQFTVFDTLGGNPVDAMYLAPTGNVGIGVANPETLLALDNGTGNPAGITQGQVAGASSLELTTADGAAAQATRMLLRGNSDDGDVEFYRGARGAESQTMIIDGATGNVGIGTSTPDSPLSVSHEGTAVTAINTSSTSFSAAIVATSTNASGNVYGIHSTADGSSGIAILGDGDTGVFGRGQGDGPNVGVRGTTSSPTGIGGSFLASHPTGEGGTALLARGKGATKDRPALRVENFWPTGVAAYITNESELATVHIFNEKTEDAGQVLYLQNGGIGPVGLNGGHFIEAVNKAVCDVQFRVRTDGEVESDVGFSTPAADFAEMMPAGADDLVPGDVLAIDESGKLIRSARAFQATVAGVYSTQPGFVGGKPLEGVIKGTIPLAVVGIVPVKASTENGPIKPGDMLTSSSTAGHAMRAGPNPPIGTVIGKALAPLTEPRGVIKLLLINQ